MYIIQELILKMILIAATMHIFYNVEFFNLSFTACFRRVLAGKRVASHWVRKTLICERLEECQRECGEEKRFSCEGFNYRLDPSGRGQGECELIEVPLSRMDLYSSPHNRDSNLIPHPDYDYYERDRMTTNCRASPCIDCELGYINPTTFRPPQSNYRPSYEPNRYRPELTAIDKYRPQNNFYESRPDSWDRYGEFNFFAAGGDHHFNQRPPQVSSYSEPRPPYVSNIDRYGTEDSGPDYYKPPPERPTTGGDYINSGPDDYGFKPQKPHNERPLPPPRPIFSESEYGNGPPSVIPITHKPPSDYDRPDPPYRPMTKPDFPQHHGGYGGNQNGFGGHPEPVPPQNVYNGNQAPLPSHQNSYGGHQESLSPQSPPPRPGIGYSDREPPSHHHKPSDYLPTNFHQKPSSSFVPYLIGQDNAWGTYGGTYGSSSGSVSYRPQIDYWGLKNEIKRKDGSQNFNYFELGPMEENNVYNRYGGPMVHGYVERERPHFDRNGMNWGQIWTRRPGTEGNLITKFLSSY